MLERSVEEYILADPIGYAVKLQDYVNQNGLLTKSIYLDLALEVLHDDNLTPEEKREKIIQYVKDCECMLMPK